MSQEIDYPIECYFKAWDKNVKPFAQKGILLKEYENHLVDVHFTCEVYNRKFTFNMNKTNFFADAALTVPIFPNWHKRGKRAEFVSSIPEKEDLATKSEPMQPTRAKKVARASTTAQEAPKTALPEDKSKKTFFNGVEAGYQNRLAMLTRK